MKMRSAIKRIVVTAFGLGFLSGCGTTYPNRSIVGELFPASAASRSAATRLPSLTISKAKKSFSSSDMCRRHNLMLTVGGLASSQQTWLCRRYTKCPPSPDCFHRCSRSRLTRGCEAVSRRNPGKTLSRSMDQTVEKLRNGPGPKSREIVG